MPNRYEREIEEILRSLEPNESRPGSGQKLNKRIRGKSGPRAPMRQHRPISIQFSPTEWLLIVTVIGALIGGGYAYAIGGGNVITLVLSLISFVCFMIVAFSYFLLRERSPRSTRYGNVTITPLRRNPLSALKTQWNLFMLRMRYRRKDRL